MIGAGAGAGFNLLGAAHVECLRRGSTDLLSAIITLTDYPVGKRQRIHSGHVVKHAELNLGIANYFLPRFPIANKTGEFGFHPFFKVINHFIDHRHQHQGQQSRTD